MESKDHSIGEDTKYSIAGPKDFFLETRILTWYIWKD